MIGGYLPSYSGTLDDEHGRPYSDNTAATPKLKCVGVCRQKHAFTGKPCKGNQGTDNRCPDYSGPHQ